MILKHLICYLLMSLLIVPTGWTSQQRAIRPVSLKMPTGEQVELYQGSYALVIGASNYQDNAWGDLSSVGEDVNAVFVRDRHQLCMESPDVVVPSLCQHLPVLD